MFQSEFIFMVLLVVWSSLVQISNKAILLDLKGLARGVVILDPCCVLGAETRLHVPGKGGPLVWGDMEGRYTNKQTTESLIIKHIERENQFYHEQNHFFSS